MNQKTGYWGLLLVLVVLSSCLVITCTALKEGRQRRTLWHQLEGYSFDQYVKEFTKDYSSFQEKEYRKEIFMSKMETILAHNSDPRHSWKMGVNHLTDRTNEEFQQLLGYKKSFDLKLTHQSEYIPQKNVKLPFSIDWRTQGIITPVKDQGQCGSCWSFGTAEVIESYYALATGELATLSEQQILDCVPNPNQCGGTGGCGGGTAELAYEQLINQGGLASEWTYPYTSYFGSNFPCHFQANTTKPIASLKSYVKLPSNLYEPVIEALAITGPLVINIDASAWHSYESGVFNGCNTTDSIIDHVVQLVGYGTDPKEGDYWLIRNSWTPAWGEDGYIRLARSSTVTCTNDTSPLDGTGCSGGPSVVSVCGACGVLYDVSYPILN